MSTKTIKIPQQLFRAVEIIRTKKDGGEEEMELSISSDTPYLRYDWWDDEEYFEVLDHAPDGIDTTRLKAGLPILFNHDRDAHLGRAGGFELKDGKCYVKDLKWSGTQFAQDKKKDMESGALPDTSVGYQITDEGECIGAKDGIPIYKFKWAPYEASLVTIPADTTVGAGRSYPGVKPGEEIPNKQIVIRDEKNLAPVKKPANNDNNDMKHRSLGHSLRAPDTETQPAAGASPKVEVVRETEAAGVDKERKRVKKISDFAKAFNPAIKLKTPMADMERKAIAEGVEFEDFRETVNGNFAELRELKSDEASAKIGMSRKDLARFSMAKLILESSSKKGVTGIEKEASEAAAKLYQNRDGRSFQGVCIPHDVAEIRNDEAFDLDEIGIRNLRDEFARIGRRRDLSASSYANGGFLVATEILGGSFIDFLRNASLLGQGPFNVIELNGLVGNIAIPKQLTTATVYWLAEGAQVTASNFTGGQLYLTPHRMGVQTNWTKQLLEQASLSVEMLVRNDIAKAIAVEEDRTGIAGSGLNGEPIGIVNTTGVGADITFSGAATRAAMIKYEYNIENANVMGMIAFMTTPLSKSKLKGTLMVSGSTFPIYIWDKNEGFPPIQGRLPGTILDYPAYATKNVPSDIVIGGVFEDNLTRARWGGLDVVTEPYTGAATETIKTYVHQWLDWGLRYPQGFETSTDAPT